MTTPEEARAKARRLRRINMLRRADALLLDALRAAGWTQADANKRDAVTAYLTDHGHDIRPVRR